MTRCLHDYTLLMLYKGDGTDQQWSHLSTCLLCTVRYQHLVRDLEKIEEILEVAPPLRTVVSHQRSSYQRWFPAVVALAATLVLTWGSVHWWQPSQTVVVAKAQPQPDKVSEFLQESVAPALFSPDALANDNGGDEGDDDGDDDGDDSSDVESNVMKIPLPVSSSTYVQAALEGGWPCEQQGPFANINCEIHPFPFFIREQ